MVCYNKAMLGHDKPLPELDGTQASAAHDRLEEILKRIRLAGGKISRDEITPLYFDFNNEVTEIGETRVVEFNFNSTDFQITSNVKDMRVGGAGPRKHLETLTRPILELKLKKKPETSDQWLSVDIDDVF